MPVEEDKNGTYILSSKDLCLIKEIPEICEMGITSLKIEGKIEIGILCCKHCKCLQKCNR